MVRKSIDKIEAVGTFLIAAAVAAFAGFTPEQLEEVKNGKATPIAHASKEEISE